MRLADLLLPPAARRGVDRVASNLAQIKGLAWVHGQGSVITGFRTDSDLDFVAVWHSMPSSPTDTETRHFTESNGLVLEQLTLHGYEVDIQHVPLHVFEQWMELVEGGDGWSGDRWPMPIHVAAGLAQGVLVLDPSGSGSAWQDRVQQPPEQAITAVVDTVAATMPGYLTEMDRARDRGDHWLHELLAVRLHKDLYTAWFLSEGHYPPFPKHLPNWFQQLRMSDQAQQIEAVYWSTSDMLDRRQLLTDLGDTILDLASNR